MFHSYVDFCMIGSLYLYFITKEGTNLICMHEPCLWHLRRVQDTERQPALIQCLVHVHQVTVTIPGHFRCTICTPKIARYSRGDLVWTRHWASASWRTVSWTRLGYQQIFNDTVLQCDNVNCTSNVYANTLFI